MATSQPQKQHHTFEEPPPTLCLHDSLALGEVGLLAEKQVDSELEEIKRLPVLLRLLSASRPLASIPKFEESDNNEEEDEDLQTTDQVANQVVAQLEDVAATYSVAEGVDVVACHLAPTICRNISKLPPLKPKKRSSSVMLMSSSSTTIITTKDSNRGGSFGTSMAWETGELMAVGSNPRSSFKRRRISQTEKTPTATSTTSLRDQPDSADELNIEGNAGAFSEGVVSSDDEEQVTEMAATAAGAAQKARPPSRRSSEPRAGGRGAEDSQEEMVAKTLSDLTALVVSALQPIKIDFDATSKTGNSNNHNKSGNEINTNNNNEDGNGQQQQQQQQHRDFHDDKDTRRGGGKLALAADDSTLSEPARSRVAADSVRGVMTGSDLGSTIASLMHHAPVLRHEHVANALCRASVPQAADLIQRMGANCPSAVPSLLRGCIDAYKSAILLMNSRHNSTVATAAKSATQALAELSEREKSRVRTVLQQEEVMVDLQLKLAISQDPLAAICLLLQHLSLPIIVDEAAPETNDIAGESIQPQPLSRNRNDSKNRSNGSRKTLCDVSLMILLKERPKLLVTAVSLVKNEMSTLVANTQGDLLLQNDFGRVCLLLRCYAWSALHFDVMKALQGRNISNEGASLLSVLQKVVDKSRRATHSADGDSSSSKGSNKGIPLSLSFCCSILTLARFLISADEADKQLVESCEAWVNSCFDSLASNAQYGTLVTRFAFALRTNNMNACFSLLLNVLRGDLCSAAADVLCPSPQLQEGLSKVCSWVMGNDEVDNWIKEALSLSATTIYDPSLLLDFICYSQDAPEGLTEKIETALRQVLFGTSSSTMAGLAHAHVPDFIVKATAYLAKNSDLRIPVLSPLELESRATRMDLRRLGCPVSVDSAEYNFLYQVLYWLAYIDAGSSAVFTFDTRNLPLKEVLRCSRILWATATGQSLSTHLENLIAKQFPEIPLQFRRWEVVNQFTRPYSAGTHTSLDRTRIKRSLCYALKSSLTDTDATDRFAAFAEKTFLVARAELTDSELCTQTVSALLSTPSSPPPFCTYSMLCRDPLILLKTPMCAWQSHGLRRIVLSVLNSLLETNEATTEMSSPTDSCIDELITSRNLLALRSTLLAVSGSQEGNSEHTAYFCSMTTHFMRLLIANNPGLIGLLVKQSPALPDCAMDYLVEFVPETMDDAESLINVFTERGSVTARLTAAAAILRIAIAHGIRDEAAAEHLVYAALAQLVSSFFLVIGPVGVPVNVLLSDDGSGQLDVTQTARRLCFRMLRSLLNVRGKQRPRLRNECGMALHKLAGLCKGENILIGVAGAVVSRRKTLLREMFEAVTKAANSMGSGIDL